MEGATSADTPVRRRPRRRWIVVAVIVGLLVAVIGLAFTVPAHPAGSELRITLDGKPTTVWIDDSPSVTQRLLGGKDVWCLAEGEPFPEPTGRWDDGIMHGGPQATGTLRFESDDVAVFRSDAGGDDIVLRRDPDPGRYCD